MPIIELIDRDIDPSRKRLIAKLESCKILLSELRGREIPEEVVNKINDHILPLNSFDGTDKQYHKALRKSLSWILYHVNFQNLNKIFCDPNTSSEGLKGLRLALSSLPAFCFPLFYRIP